MRSCHGFLSCPKVSHGVPEKSYWHQRGEDRKTRFRQTARHKQRPNTELHPRQNPTPRTATQNNPLPGQPCREPWFIMFTLRPPCSPSCRGNVFGGRRAWRDFADCAPLRAADAALDPPCRFAPQGAGAPPHPMRFIPPPLRMRWPTPGRLRVPPTPLVAPLRRGRPSWLVSPAATRRRADAGLRPSALPGYRPEQRRFVSVAPLLPRPFGPSPVGGLSRGACQRPPQEMRLIRQEGRGKGAEAHPLPPAPPIPTSPPQVLKNQRPLWIGIRNGHRPRRFAGRTRPRAGFRPFPSMHSAPRPADRQTDPTPGPDTRQEEPAADRRHPAPAKTPPATEAPRSPASEPNARPTPTPSPSPGRPTRASQPPAGANAAKITSRKHSIARYNHLIHKDLSNVA